MLSDLQKLLQVVGLERLQDRLPALRVGRRVEPKASEQPKQEEPKP